MSRADLSPWGVELPAEEFPLALAALGALTAAGRPLPHDEDLLGVAVQVQHRLLSRGAVQLNGGRVSGVPGPAHSRCLRPRSLPKAGEERLRVSGPKRGPRLEVVRPPPQLDLL
jgi:hypothetical protein